MRMMTAAMKVLKYAAIDSHDTDHRVHLRPLVDLQDSVTMGLKFPVPKLKATNNSATFHRQPNPLDLKQQQTQRLQYA
eukprot:5697746-Amphidinium_carterae.1